MWMYTYQDVFYLNAWEFLMLWEVRMLPKPASSREKLRQRLPDQSIEDLRSKPPQLTIWNDKKNEDEGKGFSVNPEAVTFYGQSGDILFYPDEAGGSEDFRNTFYMQRRYKPLVPAPASCPMPDKQRSAERRDRLYLLYLQPWVLDPSWAVPGIVPHISCLNKVEEDIGEERTTCYSYSLAWKRYITQNIVSRHAHRIIVQFMAACCGKSKTTNPQIGNECAGSPGDTLVHKSTAEIRNSLHIARSQYLDC